MRKTLIAIALLLLAASPAFAVAEIPMTPMQQGMFNDLSATMACQCGCSTTIKDCPHAQCGFAVPFRKEMTQLIKEGLPRAEVVAELVSNHGEVVLAMPSFKGFNALAWIAPFAFILIVGYGILLLIKNWVASSQNAVGAAAAPEAAENDPYLKRMREELGKFED